MFFSSKLTWYQLVELFILLFWILLYYLLLSGPDLMLLDKSLAVWDQDLLA